MQWSNNGSNSGSGISAKIKAVLPKDVAEKTVLEFVPVRFDLGTPSEAFKYLAQKERGSDFRMNDAIRIQTGIDQLEQTSDEEKIESAALEKLKEIEEGAFKEAYNLGLEQGRKSAYEKSAASIEKRLSTFDETLKALQNIKTEMATFNEAHLMKLVFQMASRLAKWELQGHNEAMLQILKDAVGLSQDEENITVRVSPSQFDFLEELKKETGREFEFIKKIRFEPSPEVADGGCIVETNYGEVDARIEQRVEQLWSVLSENIPKSKDKAAS